MAPSMASRRSPQPTVKSFFVPKLCNHCADSPCVQVCPVGATFVSPDGVVLVDETYCLGCRYCVQACPYGCRYLHPETRTRWTSAPCATTASPRGSPRPAARTVPPARVSWWTSRIPKTRSTNSCAHNKVQVLKPHMATEAKVYYKDLDGSVR